MKHLLLFAFLLVAAVNQSLSQNIEKLLIKEIWGEVNEQVKEHRGKAGLVLLNFNADFTFQAYEITCTGDNVLQTGKWQIENNSLTFDGIETKKFAEDSTRKGKILPDKDSRKISYTIKKISAKEFALENKAENKKLIFKISRFNYFPEN